MKSLKTLTGIVTLALASCSSVNYVEKAEDMHCPNFIREAPKIGEFTSQFSDYDVFKDGISMVFPQEYKYGQDGCITLFYVDTNKDDNLDRFYYFWDVYDKEGNVPRNQFYAHGPIFWDGSVYYIDELRVFNEDIKEDLVKEIRKKVREHVNEAEFIFDKGKKQIKKVPKFLERMRSE